MLKQLFNKVREWLDKAKTRNRPAHSPFYRVRYTSVPVWKPWRDL
jgi:hypothetical protein